MQFPSKLIKNSVEAISNLPGIGQKTALRFVIHLLQNQEKGYRIAQSIKEMIDNTIYCVKCNNISKSRLCVICEDLNRDASTICVVEDIRDIMAIENTMQFKGHYHVLGGLISPIDGVSPADLNISNLINKTKDKNIKEIILALRATMEGETTSYYIYKNINTEINITTISKGISVGNELEYTDQITLGRALVNRYAFTNTLNQ